MRSTLVSHSAWRWSNSWVDQRLAASFGWSDGDRTLHPDRRGGDPHWVERRRARRGVAVNQCSGSLRRSLTHDAVLCDDDTSPPACTQAAPDGAVGQRRDCIGSPPWSRSAAKSATSTAASAAGWVWAGRRVHEMLRAAIVEVDSSANPAIVRPLEIERPRPVTGSTAHRVPAVSRRWCWVRSGDRKLLWYVKSGLRGRNGRPGRGARAGRRSPNRLGAVGDPFSAKRTGRSRERRCHRAAGW